MRLSHHPEGNAKMREQPVRRMARTSQGRERANSRLSSRERNVVENRRSPSSAKSGQKMTGISRDCRTILGLIERCRRRVITTPVCSFMACVQLQAIE